MALLKFSTVLSFIIAVLIATGCGAPDGANNAAPPQNSAATVRETPKANASAEELGMRINFTLEPEDIVWRQDDGNKTVTAVFRFDAEDTKKLSDQLTARSAGSPKVVQVEDWFPAELVAKSEATGGTSVQGTAFPADDFYQHPYSQGTITRVADTDFFVIELSAK